MFSYRSLGYPPLKFFPYSMNNYAPNLLSRYLLVSRLHFLIKYFICPLLLGLGLDMRGRRWFSVLLMLLTSESLGYPPSNFFPYSMNNCAPNLLSRYLLVSSFYFHIKYFICPLLLGLGVDMGGRRWISVFLMLLTSESCLLSFFLTLIYERK